MKRICLAIVVFAITSSVAYAQQPALQRGSAAAARMEARIITAQNQRMQEQAERWRQSKKLTVLDKLPEKRRSQSECTDVLELKNGWSGYLEYWQFEVRQVVGPKDVLIGMNNPDIPLLWLTGYPTADLVDDDKVRVVGLVEVTGTKAYETVMGAKKTVRVVQLVSKEKLAEIDAKAKALAVADVKAQAWQERWETEQRLWIDKTRKYRLSAVYGGFVSPDKVRLIKKDQSNIVIPLSALSDYDNKKVAEFRRVAGYKQEARE